MFMLAAAVILLFFVAENIRERSRGRAGIQTEQIRQFSQSTEIGDIERDLSETEFDNIDRELDDIELELMESSMM